MGPEPCLSLQCVRSLRFWGSVLPWRSIAYCGWYLCFFPYEQLITDFLFFKNRPSFPADIKRHAYHFLNSHIFIGIYFSIYLWTYEPAGGLNGKEFACNAGDLGSIPGSGRSLGEGNGNPLQYSCLGNPMDRRAWWALVHGVAKSRIQLSN